MQSPSPPPYIVTVIPETPTEATDATVADLLIGVASITGLMLAAALVLGAVLAGIRVAWRRAFPPVTDHMPPVSQLKSESTLPPSSPPR